MENFGFVDGHFQHTEWTCSCGREHPVPIQEIVVKSGALNDLVGVLKRLDLGKRGMLVADLNTYDVAGERVMTLLSEAGYTLKRSLFNTHKPIHADEHALGKLLFDFEPGTSFLVSVGSGSLTDMTRVLSSRTGVPFISVATAASMDGYASPGAALVIEGVKITIFSGAPIAIVADVDVICKAPYAMTVSGFGDLLGKYNSRVDWRLSKLVKGEYHCQYIEDMVNATVDTCVANAAEIRKHTPKAVASLTEGLILSGLGMLAVGNSRPASGAEHSLSHYWEMMAILRDRPAHSHGKKVGVGTAVMAKFYQKFLARTPHDIDVDAVKQRKLSVEAWEQHIRELFGHAADRVLEMQKPLRLDWEAQRKDLDTLQANWEQIQALRAITPSYDRIVEIQQAVNGAYRPQDVDADRDYLRETLLNAKEVRPQYTVLTTADTLGWLEELVAEVVSEYR